MRVVPGRVETLKDFAFRPDLMAEYYGLLAISLTVQGKSRAEHKWSLDVFHTSGLLWSAMALQNVPSNQLHHNIYQIYQVTLDYIDWLRGKPRHDSTAASPNAPTEKRSTRCGKLQYSDSAQLRGSGLGARVSKIPTSRKQATCSQCGCFRMTTSCRYVPWNILKHLYLSESVPFGRPGETQISRRLRCRF